MGRWLHKNRKFAVEIFHNAENRTQGLCDILPIPMVTIEIVYTYTVTPLAVHCTLPYILPELQCLQGDAFGYSCTFALQAANDAYNMKRSQSEECIKYGNVLPQRIYMLQ